MEAAGLLRAEHPLLLFFYEGLLLLQEPFHQTHICSTVVLIDEFGSHCGRF